MSLPAALLGVVAFFLPWLEFSCGPVRLRFSGYEFASGRAQEKLEPQRTAEFWDRFGRELERQRPQRKGERRRVEPVPQGPLGSEPRPILWLWAVPGACAALALLALLGLPRLPTVAASAVGAAALTYFGASFEQAASDPGQTGGIVEMQWLAGYWLTWVAVAVPPLLSWLRPRRS